MKFNASDRIMNEIIVPGGLRITRGTYYQYLMKNTTETGRAKMDKHHAIAISVFHPEAVGNTIEGDECLSREELEAIVDR